MNAPIDLTALLELVAFVDKNHDDNGHACNPQPGVDCAPWCEACQVLLNVPAHVVVGARTLLNDRGIHRD